MKKLSKKLDQVTYGLNKRISENLNAVLKKRGISKYQFIEYIEKEKGFSMSRSYLSRCLNNPDEHNIPTAILLACCDCLNISFTNLISEKFDVDEKSNSDSTKTQLIDTLSLTKEYEQDFQSENRKSSNISTDTDLENSLLFVKDPTSPFFRGYCQKYYCYYFPTVSSENKSNDALLRGTFIIHKTNKDCTATLTIDTKTLDNKGNTNLKVYEGNVVLSTSVQCIHCILKSKEIGEYCFIIFRHSHLNYDSLHCRIAEVLSTSSTLDKRYPTVHRMFFSNEKIKDEDLQLIEPHLHLNYSQITITEKDILSLENISDDYKLIVSELLDQTDPDLIYRYQEDDVFKVAQKYLSHDEQLLFIAKLREKSFAYRYNKVSPKLDAIIWETLHKQGYYKKQKKQSSL